MTSQIIYKGNLRTEAIHLQSGSVIETDAPVDNHGKGERFSPTDLLATSLGACMMTVMGIKARDMDIDLTGTIIDITKIMAADPRRVSEIKAVINFPSELHLDEKSRTILERTALTCPVQYSLNADLKTDIQFTWAGAAAAAIS
jgi:putative redox protein